MAEGKARYAQQAGTWFLQLSGDLRHTLCPALNAWLDRAFAAPRTSQFLVDLTAAQTIDSTCLGTLVRIANWAKEHDTPRPVIVTSSEDITETLLAVCFDRLFELRSEADVDAGALGEVPTQAAGMQQMSELILQAHRRLCAIDARNETVFKDLVAVLERETGDNGN